MVVETIFFCSGVGTLSNEHLCFLHCTEYPDRWWLHRTPKSYRSFQPFDTCSKLGNDMLSLFLISANPVNIFAVSTVRVSGATGKADVLLTKETSGVKWTDLGQGLLGNIHSSCIKIEVGCF